MTIIGNVSFVTSKATGFVPPVKFDDGLRATIEYEFVNKCGSIRSAMRERVRSPPLRYSCASRSNASISDFAERIASRSSLSVSFALK